MTGGFWSLQKDHSNSTAVAEKSPWIFPSDSSQAIAIARVQKVDISERWEFFVTSLAGAAELLFPLNQETK